MKFATTISDHGALQTGSSSVGSWHDGATGAVPGQLRWRYRSCGSQSSGTVSRGSVGCCEANDSHEILDHLTIAELSNSAIDQMDRDELIRVIRAARLSAHLRRPCLVNGDLCVLRRLAYLARRSCQGLLAAAVRCCCQEGFWSEDGFVSPGQMIF
ncbi:MAG: hypothetical protein ACK58L_05580 [Planctomycetota bacterium]